jgi:hypothetical protein
MRFCFRRKLRRRSSGPPNGALRFFASIIHDFDCWIVFFLTTRYYDFSDIPRPNPSAC